MSKPREVFMWLFFGVWVGTDVLLWTQHVTLWAITWLAILVVVGVMEGIAKWTSGLTLRQRTGELIVTKRLVWKLPN